ncbi:MAG: hypothetical protein H0T45_04695 [Pyrinomonadaceae bacterium]|nr:hypothetical protein [Pyrinomonadaceae bacterium]
MKKSERKLLSETLSKALDPPKRKPALASHLAEYDDAETDAAQTPLPPSDGQTPSVPLSIRPVSPERDYNKRANSLERDALPAGLFPGSSKKLYDALYLRTRGAVKPVRTIQATKKDIADWSGVRNRKTIDGHLRYLETCGLVVRQWELGNVEGYLYEVRLPEEALVDRGGQTPLRGTDHSDQKRDRGTDQKRDTGGQSEVAVFSNTSSGSKTSFKTNTNDDEATALSDHNAILSEGARQLTGRAPKAGERDQWADLARLLVAELDEAAARSGGVSSVPAFLTEHLRRKLAHKSNTRHREGKQYASASATSATAPAPPDPNRRLTPEEIAEQARIIAEVIEGGYTMEQAEVQFAGSFHAEDWSSIFAMVLLQL